MRRSHSVSETSVGLFAFLDVLMSTMGSLILVLIIVTPKIQKEKIAKAATEAAKNVVKIEATPTPAPAPVPIPVVRPRETIDLNAKFATHVADLASDADAKRRAAADAQQAVSLAQERARKVHTEREKLERLLAAVNAKKDQTLASVEDLSAEGVKVETELTRRGSRLRKIRDQIAHASTEYAFVAYDGVSGTTRRPILIECVNEQIRFPQEDITLTSAEITGFNNSTNPLLAGSEALLDYWSSHSAPNDPKPYVLMVVRPSGTLSYYRARNMLERLRAPFGYELLPEDQKLAVPPPNEKATAACRQAIDQLIAKRDSVFNQVFTTTDGSRAQQSRGGHGWGSGNSNTPGGGSGKPGTKFADPFDLSSEGTPTNGKSTDGKNGTGGNSLVAATDTPGASGGPGGVGQSAAGQGNAGPTGANTDSPGSGGLGTNNAGAGGVGENGSGRSGAARNGAAANGTETAGTGAGGTGSNGPGRPGGSGGLGGLSSIGLGGGAGTGSGGVPTSAGGIGAGGPGTDGSPFGGSGRGGVGSGGPVPGGSGSGAAGTDGAGGFGTGTGGASPTGSGGTGLGGRAPGGNGPAGPNVPGGGANGVGAGNMPGSDGSGLPASGSGQTGTGTDQPPGPPGGTPGSPQIAGGNSGPGADNKPGTARLDSPLELLPPPGAGSGPGAAGGTAPQAGTESAAGDVSLPGDNDGLPQLGKPQFGQPEGGQPQVGGSQTGSQQFGQSPSGGSSSDVGSAPSTPILQSGSGAASSGASGSPSEGFGTGGGAAAGDPASQSTPSSGPTGGTPVVGDQAAGATPTGESGLPGGPPSGGAPDGADASGSGGDPSPGPTNGGGAGIASLVQSGDDTPSMDFAKRHWGYSTPQANVGFNHDVTIWIGAHSIVVGGQQPVRITRAESAQRLAALVVPAMDREARTWGRPPAHCYWVPNVKFVISPGGNVPYERLRPLVERHGLLSTVDYRLELESPRQTFHSWVQ